MDRLKRALFALCAASLGAGAAIHASAYPKAMAVIDAARLPGRFGAIYKGLWISDCATVAILAVAFALLVAFPRNASRPLIGLLVSILIGSALSIYATVGNFLPGHALLAAAALAMLAAASTQSPESTA